MVNLLVEFGLIGLLLATFISASIIPFPAEPAIFAALTFYTPILVFFISLLGGILGSLFNYYIGDRGLRWFLIKRSPEQEKKARKWFNKWGPHILLVSLWIPFIGDAFSVVAGTVKMEFRKFFFYIAIARVIKLLIIVLAGNFIITYLETLL